ncbi:hypothetical protein GCM10017668_60120 [Streptomyces tuirus]|uniref:beta-galactosidase n=1 Tax=Streptomyces tuirus TaxID=68278 RepID=A0A7G1NN12_9ACTN|nr:hypothetical protein GCM10017668_60120 [Streptomyces tuirus]
MRLTAKLAEAGEVPIRMPFAEFPPDVPAANSTGVYERSVDGPAEWAGRRIVLQVGSAGSVLLVHVDGRPVGISEDAHPAAEFGLTALVRPGERATVRLTVGSGRTPRTSSTSRVPDLRVPAVHGPIEETARAEVRWAA